MPTSADHDAALEAFTAAACDYLHMSGNTEILRSVFNTVIEDFEREENEA